jgi:hypothetical protein
MPTAVTEVIIPQWQNNQQPTCLNTRSRSPHLQTILTTFHIHSDNLPHGLRAVHLYDTHSTPLPNLTSHALLDRVHSTAENNLSCLFLSHSTGSACTPSREDVLTGSGQSPLVAFCDDASFESRPINPLS